jgi:hypothetical protein
MIRGPPALPWTVVSPAGCVNFRRWRQRFVPGRRADCALPVAGALSHTRLELQRFNAAGGGPDETPQRICRKTEETLPGGRCDRPGPLIWSFAEHEPDTGATADSALSARPHLTAPDHAMLMASDVERALPAPQRALPESLTHASL